MIGTIDAHGHTYNYLFQHPVKAGDTFKMSDVYKVRGDVDTGGVPGLSASTIFNLAGPTAFIGRNFKADHAANDILIDNMFTPPTTRLGHPENKP